MLILPGYSHETTSFTHDSKACLGRNAYGFAIGGRVCRDPIGEEGGLNLYGDVENDPINAIDELGLKVYYTNNDIKNWLDWMKKADPNGFGKQWKQLDDSKHRWTFRCIDDPAKSKATPDSEVAAGIPGHGSSGDIYVNAYRSFNSDTDGFMTPDVIIAHEVKHAADYDIGFEDRMIDVIGGYQQRLMELRAVERQNEYGRLVYGSSYQDRVKYGGYSITPIKH